jgi:hypothetical protein
MSTNNQQIIPEGVFKGRARNEWQLGETASNDPKPYVRLTFEITSGPAKGRAISRDFFFTDKTWERTVESLRACGWQGTDVSDFTGIDENEVDVCIKHSVMIRRSNGQETVVTDDEGNARYRAEIAWVGKDRSPKPMEASKLSNFRELMKARLEGVTPANNGAGQQLGKTGTDDDLPDFLRG